MSNKKSLWGPFISFFYVLLVPILIASILMSRVGSMTTHVPGYPGVARLTSNCHILRNAEYFGAGQLDGPDDFVYDNKSGVIYTSVKDGWIKKAYISKLKNSKIRFQNWVNTGGIPLGLARGLNNELIVADAHKVN
ncbi:hypothetical protein ACFE04_008199 [Oxalis oulophora]